MTVPTLDLKGTYFDFGYAHGHAFRRPIRAYAEERVALAGGSAWTGRELSRGEVLALADACLLHHREYAPDLVTELEGMAAATGLSLAELIVVGGFTDFIDTVAASNGATGVLETKAVDDCTAFLVPGSRMADGVAAFGQTWDMHEGSTENIVLLRGRPQNAPDFLTFTTAGALAMIGMNEAGVSVGINNLMSADGRPGVTWPFAVREMLKAEDLAGALAALQRAPLAGGHNYLVMDATGAAANVEAMPTHSHVAYLAEDALVHTNHNLHESTRALERPREPESQADSEARLADAERLLDRHDLSIEALQEVTAHTANICHRGEAPRFVGTCGAVVTRPASRELWAVGGRPSEGSYERFTLERTPT
ncbi:MAG: C45 family peptidase [Trueperaceae bacterium]